MEKCWPTTVFLSGCWLQDLERNLWVKTCPIDTKWCKSRTACRALLHRIAFEAHVRMVSNDLIPNLPFKRPGNGERAWMILSDSHCVPQKHVLLRSSLAQETQDHLPGQTIHFLRPFMAKLCALVELFWLVFPNCSRLNGLIEGAIKPLNAL